MDIRENPFRLGFGLMRLPKNEDGSIDLPQVKLMADRFLEAGGTYFDTAYAYDSGESEKAFKAAIADRYPREQYTVATKLIAWNLCHDEASAKHSFSPAWKEQAQVILTSICCMRCRETTIQNTMNIISGTL